MNRRGFIASLPFLPAAVKAALAPGIRQWTVILERPAEHLIVQNFATPFPIWFQTKRTTRCVSAEYLEAVAICMNPAGSAPWIDAHRSRARRKLSRQLETPAPNLP